MSMFLSRGGMRSLLMCAPGVDKNFALGVVFTLFGLYTGGENMRSDAISRDEFRHILAALTPANRLVLEVSLATGLRVGDVLDMRSCALAARITVRELKTGKNRRIRIPVELLTRMQAIAGKVYVFEGRYSALRHRTRQAVYNDLKRAAALFRLPVGLQISPHTARKVYAVSEYHRSGSLARVQQLLLHSSEAVTMVYAMADAMTERRMGGCKYVKKS